MLGEIAYAVSSYEACDWGEASYVETLIERLPDAVSTLGSLEGAIGPWLEVAENAAFEHYAARLGTPHEVEPGRWSLKVQTERSIPAFKREMQRRMRLRHVKAAAGKSVALLSSSMRGGDDYSTEHYYTYDHPNAGIMGLRAQVRDLERKLSGYEAWARAAVEAKR